MQIKKNRVMEISSNVSQFTNHDYDGDTMISVALHSKQAKEDFHELFVNNLVEFEHRDSLLFSYEHESIYAAYMLTKLMIDNINGNRCSTVKVKNFAELREKYITMEYIQAGNLIIDIEDIPISINGSRRAGLHLYEWLINRSMNDINWDESQPNGNINNLVNSEDYFEIYYQDRNLLNKKNLMNLTYSFWKKLEGTENEKQFYNWIHELNKLFLELGTIISDCNPSFKLEDFAVSSSEITKYKENLLQVEPYLAFHQNLVLFNNFIKPEVEKDSENILPRVFDSGARLKSVQLLKAASNTGIPTDIYGKAAPVNIKNSLLDGLTQKEYFGTGDSARLALMQRQDAIPKGGELQRKFFFSTGILNFRKDVEDCQEHLETKDRCYETLPVLNKSHLMSLRYRFYLNEETMLEAKIDGTEDHLIGTNIKLRSPIRCKTESFGICKTCFGTKQPSSKHVGASLGSYIAEGIIQSVLRTHHFGGAFITEEDKKISELFMRVKVRNGDTIIGNKEDIDYIRNFLDTKYPVGDIEFLITEKEENNELLDTQELKIIVKELPFNDDSVKILNGIVSLIDKNRDAAKGTLREISDIYSNLVEVITQNNILSIYFEMILSLLFYDENGILIRYSSDEIFKQVALKNVIEQLDPKLSIFYNFSNRAISNVYKAKFSKSTKHMYNDILDIYY